MPVALTEKMNISGIWQSINCTAKTAAKHLAAAKAQLATANPHLALPAKKAPPLLLRRKQQLQARSRNFFKYIISVSEKYLLMSADIFFGRYSYTLPFKITLVVYKIKHIPGA